MNAADDYKWGDRDTSMKDNTTAKAAPNPLPAPNSGRSY